MTCDDCGKPITDEETFKCFNCKHYVCDECRDENQHGHYDGSMECVIDD